MEEKSIPWQELLEAVFRRFRITVVTTLIGLMAAVVVSLFTPHVYKAVARVQFTSSDMPGTRADAMGEKQIQAELALIKSETLIQSALQARESSPPPSDVAVSESGEDVGVSPSESAEAVESASPIFVSADRTGPSASFVKAIARRIDAQPVGRSNLVEVSFRDEDPVEAALFVNTLVESHAQRIAELNEQTSALGIYQQQKDLLANQWLKAQEALREYRKQKGSEFLTGDEKQRQAVVSKLEADKVAAETQYLELQARIEYLQRALVEYPKTVDEEMTVTENESVRMLKQRVMELEIERSQKLSLYTPTSKIVQDLDRQLVEAERLLAQKEGDTLAQTTTALSETYKALEVDLVQTQAQLTSTAARVNALSAQIVRYRQELGSLELAAGELARLESEVESAREAHQNYSRKEEQARFSRSLDESLIVNMQVVEEAEVPTVPESSNSAYRILIWTLLGFVVGLVISMARDLFDSSIKSETQLSRIGGLPVIGRIPAS